MRVVNRPIRPEASATVLSGADIHILFTCDFALTLMTPRTHKQLLQSDHFPRRHLNQNLYPTESEPGNAVRRTTVTTIGSETRPSIPGSRTNLLAAPHGIKPPTKLQLLTPPPSTWRLATAKSAPASIALNSLHMWWLQIAVNHSQHLPSPCHPNLPRW